MGKYLLPDSKLHNRNHAILDLVEVDSVEKKFIWRNNVNFIHVTFPSLFEIFIKVGNVEKTIQPPPKGFPKCGNFVGCDAE